MSARERVHATAQWRTQAGWAVCRADGLPTGYLLIYRTRAVGCVVRTSAGWGWVGALWAKVPRSPRLFPTWQHAARQLAGTKTAAVLIGERAILGESTRWEPVSAAPWEPEPAW
ncbi:MAG: hypothetical protein M3443_04130 [Actinomycetota bacterium]|nr:hypothetical protein [Actinomycetota bacterium]